MTSLSAGISHSKYICNLPVGFKWSSIIPILEIDAFYCPVSLREVHDFEQIHLRNMISFPKWAPFSEHQQRSIQRKHGECKRGDCKGLSAKLTGKMEICDQFIPELIDLGEVTWPLFLLSFRKPASL